MSSLYLYKKFFCNPVEVYLSVVFFFFCHTNSFISTFGTRGSVPISCFKKGMMYVCMYVNLYLNTGNHQLSLS